MTKTATEKISHESAEGQVQSLLDFYDVDLEDLPEDIRQRWLGAYHWLSRHAQQDKVKKILSSLV